MSAAAGFGRWLERLTPRRLWVRIVALFLGLLLLVQAASFGVIGAGIEAYARRQLAGELAVGERIWQRLLDQKAQTLRQGAALLAADYGFRGAVASGDEATISSALENHGARIGATVSAWLDTGFTVRALHADGRPAAGATLRRIAQALDGRRGDSVLALLDAQPHQFVAVPMKAPLTIGWVVMGFPIDGALAADMQALSGLQVAMLARTAGARPALTVSTLPDAQARELAAAVAGAGGAADLVLAGEAMVARRIPLVGAAGAPGAEVLLLRSVDDALAPFRQLQWLLAVITLAGVLVFGLGSVLTARRVTTPLQRLVRASERLGRGEHDEPLADTGRRDEIGDLAQAFDHMRTNVAAHAEEIRQLAFWDRLTGLPNRVRFRALVQQAITSCLAQGAGRGPDGAAAHHGRVAVVMLDLDRFKHVNDVLGYAFGDRLLVAVAERLRSQLRHDDERIARFSGDEFALLLPEGDAAQAQALVARIVAAFEVPLTLDDQTVDLSAGFGIACWPEHAEDADALLNRAEVAMYAAKRKAMQVLVYDPGIDSGSAQTLSLLSELRHALDHQELRLFVQPKVALDDGRLVGAEALVRWQHPGRGMVPPMAFIPFAEQTGFVRQLTLWIFDEAARQWPRLHAAGVQRLSVNLSTRDLMDQELPLRLDAILLRRGVPAEAFCLEITESAIMEEPQRAEATVRALSAGGFKLSIDDFGTGYSSLAYLKQLPVDELKIDKSFVIGMAEDADDAKIVRSTIDLAHNLGLRVVAEGVENAVVWQQLRALQCDEAQGFWIGRPMPAEELPAFAARWAAKAEAPAAAALVAALH